MAKTLLLEGNDAVKLLNSIGDNLKEDEPIPSVHTKIIVNKHSTNLYPVTSYLLRI